MAPKYVLNYFNTRGRAETARMMFAAAGVEYTDHRIEGQEWPKNKSDTKRFPLGTMPTLQVDDKVLVQSQAINRYLARELGFYGSNSMEQATIDGLCETLTEIATPFISAAFEKDKELQKEKFSKLLTETKHLINFLENALKANNGGKSFFVGDKISLADIGFFTLMETFLAVNPTALDSFTHLKALSDRIAAIEKIAAWIKTRPKSNH